MSPCTIRELMRSELCEQERCKSIDLSSGLRHEHTRYVQNVSMVWVGGTWTQLVTLKDHHAWALYPHPQGYTLYCKHSVEFGPWSRVRPESRACLGAIDKVPFVEIFVNESMYSARADEIRAMWAGEMQIRWIRTLTFIMNIRGMSRVCV